MARRDESIQARAMLFPLNSIDIYIYLHTVDYKSPTIYFAVVFLNCFQEPRPAFFLEYIYICVCVTYVHRNRNAYPREKYIH